MPTQSEGSKPFRFFDLPLELQGLILSKYYEEPWTMKLSSTAPLRRPRYQSTLTQRPLLVSRRFSQESKLAVARSRHNELAISFLGFDKIIPEHALKYTEYWDPAISFVTTLDVDWHELTGIEKLKYRFPNLNAVQREECGFLSSEVVTDVGLLSVIQGEADSQIAAGVCDELCITKRLRGQELDLCGVVIWFSTIALVGACWHDAKLLVETGLACECLIIDFELTGEGCRVSNKCFMKLDGNKGDYCRVQTWQR